MVKEEELETSKMEEVSQSRATLSLALPSPEPFSFVACEWEKWIRRFDRFRTVSGLINRDEETQISTLIYSMGQKGEDVYDSLKLSEEDKKKYATVVNKFTNFFIPKSNIVFERAKFNQRKQMNGESAESFITDLHHLAERCQYGQLKSELIRDRIVVGITNSKFSEKLQMIEDLTLEKATNMVMPSEAVHSHQGTIRGEAEVSRVQSQKPSYKSSDSKHKPNFQPQEGSCSFCGFSSHSRQYCPANQKECMKCHGLGHFARCCKGAKKQASSSNSKKKSSDASNKQKASTNVGNLFLGTVSSSVLSLSSTWTADIKVGDKEINYIVDTGADVSCIPTSSYEGSMGAIILIEKKLHGPSGDNLDCIGKVHTTFAYKNLKKNCELYILNGLAKPLLGRPDIEKTRYTCKN